MTRCSKLKNYVKKQKNVKEMILFYKGGGHRVSFRPEQSVRQGQDLR